MTRTVLHHTRATSSYIASIGIHSLATTTFALFHHQEKLTGLSVAINALFARILGALPGRTISLTNNRLWATEFAKTLLLFRGLTTESWSTE